MKKILITLLFALCLTCSTNAQKKVDVEVNIPSTVKVFKGDSTAIAIQTSDKSIYKMIDYVITDSLIKIDLKDNLYYDNLMIDDSNIRINIEMPEDMLRSIKTNNKNLVAYIENKKK